MQKERKRQQKQYADGMYVQPTYISSAYATARPSVRPPTPPATPRNIRAGYNPARYVPAKYIPEYE